MKKGKNWLSRKPFVRLLTRKKVSALGRSRGKIVLRYRACKIFSFSYNIERNFIIWNLPAVVISLERSYLQRSYVALLAFPIGLMCYVTAVAGQTIGDKVTVGWDVPCKIGNALPLLKIPLNVKICCIEAVAGSGAVYARAPGNWAVIVAKNNIEAKLAFNGGRYKYLNLNCFARIGRVSNLHWSTKRLWKAGQVRVLGRRPRVRGVAKNPVDHPHGGGKGKKSKNTVPEAPWGRLGPRKKKNVTVKF